MTDVRDSSHSTPSRAGRTDARTGTARARVGGGLLDPGAAADGRCRTRVRKLDPRTLWQQPGDAHRRDRRRCSPPSLAVADPGDCSAGLISRLAVADRGLRQPGRGGRRGPRQGAGRDAAPGQDRHRGAPAVDRPTAAPSEEPVPAPSCGTATWSSARPATSSPATATSSRASPASTSRAITGESAPGHPGVRRRPLARSPAAPRCSPTGSSWRSRQKPGESFIDRMIAPGRGRQPAEDAERDRAEHPARRR